MWRGAGYVVGVDGELATAHLELLVARGQEHVVAAQRHRVRQAKRREGEVLATRVLVQNRDLLGVNVNVPGRTIVFTAHVRTIGS